MTSNLPSSGTEEAELALVKAVAVAVLEWAGLEEEEAEEPGAQMMLIPDRVNAELIGKMTVEELGRRGIAIAILK